MRAYLVACGILLVSSPARPASIIGGGLAYGSDIGQPGFRLEYFEEFHDSPWRIGAQLTPFFPRSSRENAGFETTTFQLSSELNLQRMLLQHHPTFVYVTTGLHLDYSRSSFAFDDPERPEASDSAFDLGLAAGLGVELDVMFSGLYGEVSYAAVSGGLSQLFLALGLRFYFH